MSAAVEQPPVKKRRRDQRKRSRTPSRGLYRLCRPVTPPTHTSPLVRRLYELMHEQQIGYQALSERSGVPDGSLTAWRKRYRPNLLSFEAALNALGYELRIMKRRDVSENAEDGPP